jgi:D-alanyl-lipoteichoic acid acyltransferase DltB (MBOAT superfamily)
MRSGRTSPDNLYIPLTVYSTTQWWNVWVRSGRTSPDSMYIPLTAQYNTVVECMDEVR